MTRRRTMLALPFAALVACSGSGDGRGGQGQDQLPDEDILSGQYAITSHFDLSSAEGTPERAKAAVSALTGLADDPAGTMFALLQAADLPVLGELLDSVPSVLVDQVAGFMNEYLVSRLYDGVPAAEVIANIADDVATALTDFEVASTFDLGAMDGEGVAGANHRLAAVAFQLGGARQEVDTPELIDTLTQANDVECSVTLDSGVDPGEHGGTIAIGEHAFNLPLGDFLIVALDQALEAQFGVGDLAEALGLVVDCAGMATYVGGQCLLGVCIGHEPEIEAVCLAGLDLVASKVEEQIVKIDYAALRLMAGEAALATGDGGLISRFDPGMWQVALDVDGRELPTSATFVGRR